MPKPSSEQLIEKVVPSGVLRHLKVSEIQPSRNNPRVLFDSSPLAELRADIREHGVLVPITVYPLRGQKKFGILDGEDVISVVSSWKRTGSI